MSIYSEDFKKMTWAEFSSLLCGLGADTPLARTVQIRLETDKDVIKNFNSSQRRIRDKWRSRTANKRTQADINTALHDFQMIFANM